MYPITKYDSRIKKHASLCVFSSYHAGVDVDEFIYFHLNQLLENNFDIVFVSNSKITEQDLAKLKKICKRVIEKANVGLDFPGYKIGLLSEDYGRTYDNVLLTNVSIYGPLFPLQNIIKKMEIFDFWGLTENFETNYHLQSFFLYFNSKVTHSKVWKDFWDNVVELEDKEEIISYYEIGLSRALIESSLFNYSCYLRYFDFAKYLKEENGYYFSEGPPDQKKCNVTLFYWDIIINKFNFPYLKKTLVDKKGHWKEAGIITNHWKEVISGQTNYPIKLINEM